jgi:hypothetical protein
MPRLTLLKGGAAIYIYADDHAPPHFHVLGPRTDVQIRIDTLQIMRGRISRSDLIEAIEWATAHPDMLVNKWRELNERD